jgi:hypothetical protein
MRGTPNALHTHELLTKVEHSEYLLLLCLKHFATAFIETCWIIGNQISAVTVPPFGIFSAVSEEHD